MDSHLALALSHWCDYPRMGCELLSVGHGVSVGVRQLEDSVSLRSVMSSGPSGEYIDWGGQVPGTHPRKPRDSEGRWGVRPSQAELQTVPGTVSALGQAPGREQTGSPVPAGLACARPHGLLQDRQQHLHVTDRNGAWRGEVGRAGPYAGWWLGESIRALPGCPAPAPGLVRLRAAQASRPRATAGSDKPVLPSPCHRLSLQPHVQGTTTTNQRKHSGAAAEEEDPG